MATIDLGKIKLVWRGTYNNSTAYVVDDLVAFTDSGVLSTYICVANSTGNAPSTGGTAHASWNYVAQGTAAETNASIRTKVEAATDSNVFTDADHTKLNGIEASATADQTASEIKTLLQSDKLTVNEIADDAITTAKILDDAVTDAKLANSINTAIAANTAKVTNATHTGDVTGSTALTIANDAVTTDKIADDAVTADKLANSINTEIAANTAKVTNATHTGDVTGATSLTIANDAVTTDKINLISTSSVPSLEAKGDGSSQDGYIQLNCSQNSHGIKLKSPPHSANASYTLTFPNTDGNADQVLKTDGSGGLDWVDQTTDTNTTYSAGSGLSLSGTTFSVDTLNQDTTGSAATLTTPRAINGVNFDGSADITIFDSTKMPLAGGTFTGTIIVEDAINENVFAITDASSVALDPDNGMVQTWTLGANRTATDSLTTGQSVLLIVTASGSNYTLTWPTMKWRGGSAPTLGGANPTAIELFKVGSQLYGATVGDLS